MLLTYTYSLQNELCRMRLDVSTLDELVREYCVYRGIVDSAHASPSGECLNFCHFNIMFTL